jgi:undecaprenyl pyrophosphate phosphatase UppP
VIASLPIGVAGLLFQKTVEEELRNNLFLIGAMLILVGLAMLWGELLGSRKKSLGKLSFVDAAIIGVAQALAIVPGTSRSGITITAALLRNLDPGRDTGNPCRRSQGSLRSVQARRRHPARDAHGLPDRNFG